MTITFAAFNDIPCAWLSNGQVRLAVTTSRGPRVLFWGWEGGPNLFAELPDFVVDSPAGPFHFLGGHRLWHGPETLAATYWPDDQPVQVRATDQGAVFTPPPDGLGIVKEIELALAAGRPEVTVTHRLRNAGSAPTGRRAAWALSMCRLGGVALLPQPHGPVDPAGLLPNRRLVFWPYADLADPRLILGDLMIRVEAQPAPPFKLGYFNRDGWLAYWLDGALFTKSFKRSSRTSYPDLGCNVECYLNDRFVEIETLGPLLRLAPGDTATHVETWRLQAGVPRPAAEL
ncbi:MAG: hypothetical protein JXM73_03530 [Anaerolineae bacterium]|nr:hypothetical protein [Anaerolineae bacterium]